MATVEPDRQLAEAEVTLATIRDWADSMHRAAAPGERAGHAAGYDSAVRDVLAILDSRGRPPGEPVVLPP